MKKLLFISLFAALLLAGCKKEKIYEGDDFPPTEQVPGDDDGDNQDDGDDDNNDDGDDNNGSENPDDEDDDNTGIPDDEIWYTSSDGNIVEPLYTDRFGEGVEILSNTYENGKGVIKFNAPVTEIGSSAFYQCTGLTSITIPDSVTTIEYNPFRRCEGLTAFYGKFASDDNRCLIVDGVLKSFAPAGLTEYTIPDGVSEIGLDAFSYCRNLTSVTIPDGVTTIGNMAFWICTGLTSITIPDSVTTIGDKAFYRNESLTSITIPDSVTTIGYNPFELCSRLTAFYGKFASEDNRCLIVDGVLKSFAPAGLTEYTIPGGVTTIGGSAFSYYYGLTSITIPDSVTFIGAYAFDNCVGLTSITIPDSVTRFGGYAFNGCTGLTSVYCRPTTPPAMIDDFSDINKNAKIYVPRASVEAYKAANNWSKYADIIQPYDF